jgi:hypothetical protein
MQCRGEKEAHEMLAVLNREFLQVVWVVQLQKTRVTRNLPKQNRSSGNLCAVRNPPCRRQPSHTQLIAEMGRPQRLDRGTANGRNRRKDVIGRTASEGQLTTYYRPFVVATLADRCCP